MKPLFPLALVLAACGAPAPPAAEAPRFAGSASCAPCHPAEHDAWRASHHALAERPLEAVSDLAAFAGSREVVSAGGTASVGLRDGRPVVHLADEDGTLRTFPAERAFAVAPLWQVLVDPDGPEPDSGRLQATQIAYDPARDEWFDVFGDDGRKPPEWGSWAGRGMNWNSMCAHCHNTNVAKNYDPVRDGYATTFAEHGVACEACHGPASDHVAHQRASRAGGDPALARLRFPSDAVRRTDACGTCHARREMLREGGGPHDSLLANYFPELPGAAATFLADGRVHDEDFEYASFLLSRLSLHGVSCTDCHEPHSARPRLAGDALCMSCHAQPVGALTSPIEPVAHAHHPPGTATCVDCHMPRTTYMQRHPRHDHSFSTPDPLLTRELGLPNACDGCHDDRPPGWTQEAAERWYGERLARPRRARARIVARVRNGDPAVLGELLAWSASEEHGAWRAVACNLLAAFVDAPPARERLLAALADPDPLVRATAARALEPAPAQAHAALTRALDDDVRAVRLLAARALRGSGLERAPLAAAEFAAFLALSADQPAGRLLAAAVAEARGEGAAALAHVGTALTWDPGNLELVRLRSQLHATAGRDGDALASAREGVERFPDQALAWFDLGLAHAAPPADVRAAAAAFERAAALDPRFPRALYNLGLARAQLGESDAALDALERASRLVPQDAEILYALATVARDAGRIADALRAARELARVVPQAPLARSLLTELEAAANGTR